MTTAFSILWNVLDYTMSGDWAAVEEIVRHTDLAHEKLIEELVANWLCMQMHIPHQA